MKSKLSNVLPVMAVLFMLPSVALAGDGDGMIGLGAGLAVGLAAIGCGLGQGRLAEGAMNGMARNPQAAGGIRTSMLLALAFPESLVLFCFAIAFLLMGKIG